MKKREFPRESNNTSPHKRVARSHSSSHRKHSYSEHSLDDDNSHHLDWFAGQTFCDRYIVERELGIGTFGKVFECKDLKHKDFVAIKVIRKVNKYIESAEIEKEILDDIYFEQSRQRKSYCVKLYSTFKFDGHFFMVFEPLGLSLYDLIKKNDYIGLPLMFVKSISKQILGALDFLQSMQLIHTDLKLENILFRTSYLEQYSVYCPRKRQHMSILIPTSSSIKRTCFVCIFLLVMLCYVVYVIPHQHVTLLLFSVVNI